ncbi:MAG: hypothetical protein P8X67_15580 [Syntrophobacterales bacterium]
MSRKAIGVIRQSVLPPHSIVQGEFVLSATKRVLPEDAWRDGDIRNRSNILDYQVG